MFIEFSLLIDKEEREAEEEYEMSSTPSLLAPIAHQARAPLKTAKLQTEKKGRKRKELFGREGVRKWG